MTHKPLISAWAIALMATLSPALRAHDFWMEPSDFHPRPGTLVSFTMKSGHAWDDGEQVPRDDERIVTFALLGPLESKMTAESLERSRKAISGPNGVSPAGSVRIEKAGLHAVLYNSKPKEIELDGEKFEAYLDEEGLDHVSKLRAEQGKSASPAKELYSRSVKCLLLAAEGEPGKAVGFDQPIGLPLELVPEADPFQGDVAELPLKLLFQGKPLSSALVIAYSQEGSPPVRGRTDDTGRVKLALAGPGPWMIKSTHMVASTREGFDWESTWASLTFARRSR